MAAFFNLAILDSVILVIPLILTHTCQEWFPPFAQKKLTHISLPTICKKNFTHSFWLNLMMVAILNSSILNSAIFDSAILHKTQIQTKSIWLKLIHSHSTWWWQPSWILPSWIHPFCTKKNFPYSFSITWWWQPSWILLSWIHPFCTKKLHSFILT